MSSTDAPPVEVPHTEMPDQANESHATAAPPATETAEVTTRTPTPTPTNAQTADVSPTPVVAPVASVPVTPRTSSPVAGVASSPSPPVVARVSSPAVSRSVAASAESAASRQSSSASRTATNSSGAPSRSASLHAPSSSFPFWIGSWNMGAKEMPPAPERTAANPLPPSPLAAWIPTGYRMYVIGLQESVSEAMNRELDVYFASPAFSCVRLQLPNQSTAQVNGGVEPPSSGTVKTEGRGDGSFVRPKATSIAVWVHCSARSLVHYCAHGALSLGLTQGSKGGAAIALKVMDSTMVFVSCHLSSTTLASRRQSYASLIESVGNALGERYFQLLEQFHHTFFLGDLNFRLKEGFGAPEAVKFMQRKDVAGLLAYDELSSEMHTPDGAFNSFVEAPIDFFPTYKKHESRTIPTPSRDNAYWVFDVYKTIYKQPWYKSGNTAQRVPSWCDRIIRHSLPDQVSRLRLLQFHPDEDTGDASACSPRTLSRSRIGGVGSLCTYRALEDGLSSSDHTAVSCGFELSLPRVIDWPARSVSPVEQVTIAMAAADLSAPITHSTSTSSNAPAVPPRPTPSPSNHLTLMRSASVTTPVVFIVRLLSVRVLQSPGPALPQSPIVYSYSSLTYHLPPTIEVGADPKYVRILFPAPFEAAGETALSRQVNFTPNWQVPTDPQQQLHRVAQALTFASESSGSSFSAADSSSPCRAEFRCMGSENVHSSRLSQAAGLPAWAPYHFLIKIHSADDISGQCVVALPRVAFESKQVLEFRERMSRDGLPLLHPHTKEHMQVHFLIALDMAEISTTMTPASDAQWQE